MGLLRRFSMERLYIFPFQRGGFCGKTPDCFLVRRAITVN